MYIIVFNFLKSIVARIHFKVQIFHTVSDGLFKAELPEGNRS